MPALVSTIIPVYDGERFLSEALDSALAQTYPYNEIIVVDDGSTDSSGAIADRYARLHPRAIRVIHQANRGTGAARNTAIEAAHGSYIAMLDQDDIWLPSHLAEAIHVLEREPSIGLVHANIQAFDSAVHPPPIRSWQPNDDAFTKLLLRRGHISCLTVVFRRELVDAVGPFDPAFYRLGNDDRDMWLRIAKVAGVHYINSVHAHWRRHDNNQSSNYEKMRQGQLLLVERYAVGPYRSLRREAIAAIEVETGYAQLHSRHGSRLDALASYTRALYRDPFLAEAWKGATRALLLPRRGLDGE